MTGFQRQVNQYPSPGVEGTWASANQYASYVAGEGSVVANTNGVTMGRFGWTLPTPKADGTVTETAYNTSVGIANGLPRTPAGFIMNHGQGNFTGYLQESSMNILGGQNMALMPRGDFWAVMVGQAAIRGYKAFVNLFTGQVSPYPAATIVSAAAVTASFATNVMTVTATTGVLAVGQAITAAVGATALPANTYIASLGTGTGGAGTYNLSTTPGTIASQANVASNLIETNFTILSASLAGELAKIGRD